MQARVEATTAEIGEFVEQNGHHVLVLDGTDDDVVYALEILGGLDRSDDGNIYLNFGHPCRHLPTWMDELVGRLGTMIEGGNALRDQEGQRPWPALPQEALDGRRSPWTRMRALIEFIDALVLFDDPALAGSDTRPEGVVVLWSLVPLHVDDIAGYKGLLAHLIVGERPACRLRHRFVVRDDRSAPFLVPELDAARTPGVAIITLDFSPERLNEDLNAAVSDPALPDEQRILTMFQLAAVDFAEQRHEQATEKYAVVYDFYEGKNQPGMQGLCLAGVGDVALRQGDAATALARYQQALALVCPTKKLPLMLNPMLGAGEASYQCGRFDDAAGYFAHAADIARAQLNPNVVSDARAKQGTCTTCGQHYFVHFADDFSFTTKLPTGGTATGNTAYWSALDQVQGGKRLVLTNAVVGGEDEQADDDGDGDAPSTAAAPKRTAFVYLCRSCGALHRDPGSQCLGCGRTADLVALLAVQQRENAEGHLHRCISCGAHGRRMGNNYREPARPVRAITVSDVHVLAQNMLQQQQASERKRLIIFADNRQDAAFQAGWMQDHARRYRLRALMYERIAQGPASVGDLVAWLDRRLEDDDELSQALIPEVWRAARKDVGAQHAEERRFFLRVHVLREITNGLRQRIGLEPWGRLRVRYLGLVPELPFFQQWAKALRCTPEAMVEAAASLLDLARRSAALRDHIGIFAHWWSEGHREVLLGYVQPSPSGPRAFVCEREPTHARRLGQWLSTRGQTRAVALAKRWGVDDEQVRPFLEGLWRLLSDELQLLVPVTLFSRWRKPLPDTHDGRQVDADKLLLEPHRGLWRCGTCRRTQLRPGPNNACIQWRCAGTVKHVAEDPDNYDLRVLDEQFTLVRAQEHSAQVPVEEREIIERSFKSESERVNTLVATPTLELGVDIGALDSVLMRNVPPIAANYWQRAGRAGRRHRMAVNLTYAGAKTHDRAYFHDPLKLLGGPIEPPRFNLRNEPMVRKHVHACVLSELQQLARPERGLAESERAELLAALDHAFPNQVRGYLFSPAGDVLRASFELSPFEQILVRYHGELVAHVHAVFAGCWPDEDREVVRPERLVAYVREMGEQLAEVVARLARRLQWALSQMARLDEVRQRKGTLDPAEESMRSRCDRMVKRLKGMDRRRRGEVEGYDDTLTYSVLAAEGFLPGYGLDVGTVLAYHQAPRSAVHLRDFQFRRANSLALREYVPGNFLYANGHRFFPRFYHLEALNRGGQVEPLAFFVDVANEAVTELGTVVDSVAGIAGAYLPAVPICDVDLPHQSHIADDEDYRFQLPVAVFGHELDIHEGGRAYRWQTRDVQLRRQVRLRLVNVGARRLVSESNFGYPVCLVCGQSRSPFASQAELGDFSRSHQDRCGQPVASVGFYADEIADALRFPDCENRREAHSLAEALRMGAADVLEMERDDLQILVIGQPGREQVDMVLYDPMSGGSGLLDQMVERWDEVVAAARRVTAECPSQCDVSCIDCLQHYRNAWAHSHLDRHLVVACIDAMGPQLRFAHEIPECRPASVSGPPPTNRGEAELEQMLLRASLPAPERQREIDLGMPFGRTIPDLFYEDPDDRTDGLCIYLDGLSEAIHGNPEARRRDRKLRGELEARGYEVVEIAASELSDVNAMRGYIARIARILVGKQRSRELREDTSWFQASAPTVAVEEAANQADWSELFELVDERWHALFEGLREHGVPAPENVEWEIEVSGRVVDGQAVAVWRPDGDWIALVEQSLAASLPASMADRLVVAAPNTAADELAQVLRVRLNGGAS